ncbi:MAG: hypothetical protein EPO08_13335 [Rhodospirillaceae bacterium]|nr:MAG: hypothetical protein EPO08_13335 [Rhodospirillaceae bacterium]
MLVVTLAAVVLLSGSAMAENKKACDNQQAGAQGEQAKNGNAPIGYGGAKVQMMPFMVPYRDDAGVHYQPLAIRLVLDAGPNERPACFGVPYVHDRLLAYLYRANLTADDFVGERRDMLAKNLFDAAVDMVGKGFYTGVEIVGPDSAALDCKSATLTSQCK